MNRIMFETVAKNKICPFLLLNEPENGGMTKEEIGIYKNANCITGECMAWQYIEMDYAHVGKHIQKETTDKTDRGYCVRLEDGK